MRPSESRFGRSVPRLQLASGPSQVARVTFAKRQRALASRQSPSIAPAVRACPESRESPIDGTPLHSVARAKLGRLGVRASRTYNVCRSNSFCHPSIVYLPIVSRKATERMRAGFRLGIREAGPAWGAPSTACWHWLETRMPSPGSQRTRAGGRVLKNKWVVERPSELPLQNHTHRVSRPGSSEPRPIHHPSTAPIRC